MDRKDNEMKLYIRQKVMTVGDKYDITDERGRIYFHVESELLAIPARIRLFDINKNEVLLIKRNISFPLASYEILRDGQTVAGVKSEFALFSSKITVTSDTDSFQVDGDLFSMNFTLLRNGQPFAGIHKELIAIGDSYELDIFDDIDIALACALVIIIDNLHHKDN